VARLDRFAPSLQHPRPGCFLLNFGAAQFKTGFNRLINMAKKSLCLRELRGLRASSSSSGLLRPPSRRVPLCSRKEKNSHGGHGVHGGFDRYRAYGSARAFFYVGRLGAARGGPE
jgi:hypothetical protein